MKQIFMSPCTQMNRHRKYTPIGSASNLCLLQFRAHPFRAELAFIFQLLNWIVPCSMVVSDDSDASPPCAPGTE